MILIVDLSLVLDCSEDVTCSDFEYITLNIGKLLYNIPMSLKNQFRQQEKIRRKLIDFNWSINFNKFCINETFFKLPCQFANDSHPLCPKLNPISFHQFLFALISLAARREQAPYLWSDLMQFPAGSKVSSMNVTQSVTVHQ